MVPVPLSMMDRIAGLFAGSGDTLILSCLQGHMGKAWADALPHPSSALVITGDFCFVAGQPDAALLQDLAAALPGSFLLTIPHAPDWEPVIEQAFAGRYERFLRYAIRKEPERFDRDRLQAFVDGLPDGHALVPLAPEWFDTVRHTPWCADFVSLFEGAEDYARRGIGWLVLCQGELVAGASSYSVYDGGIEIEIDTREDHRRKGLALACAARLMLDCLDRGLYPSWDAANTASVALAEKLGYRLSHAYATYGISLPGEEAPGNESPGNALLGNESPGNALPGNGH